MIPRHEWLRNRVSEILRELDILEKQEDWTTYRAIALELSKELHYALSEWGVYYRE
jgi:hypothetical protein